MNCYLCKKPTYRCHGKIREVHAYCLRELEIELFRMRQEMIQAKVKRPVLIDQDVIYARV